MVEVQQCGLWERSLTKCVLFVISFYGLLSTKELASIHVNSYILNAFQFKILTCSFNSLQIQSLHGYPPPFTWSHTFWMHSNIRTLFVVPVVYNSNHFICTHLHVHMDSYKSGLSVGTIFICLFAQIFIKWPWKFNDKEACFHSTQWLKSLYVIVYIQQTCHLHQNCRTSSYHWSKLNINDTCSEIC
jgi:hypothetical protein